MSSGSDLLWVLAAAAAVTSASFTGFTLRQRPYRGLRWWSASLWLTTIGVCAAASGVPGLAGIAAALLIQWPILAIVGLRRFHARIALPCDEPIDWAVLLVAGTLAASGPVWTPDSAIALLVPSAGATAVHLYAASMAFGGPSGRDRLPLLWLGLTMALVGLGPLPAAWPGYDAVAPIGLRAAAATFGSIVTAFVALTLVCERSERQLHETHRRLRVLSNIDALANSPDRRHFHDLATQAIHADAPGTASLLMFDIDHFRRINDELGHATGDRALRLVSTSLQELLRSYDIAGRHGGDEFVLLLRQTHMRDAMGVASRIVKQLMAQTRAAELPPLSMSFGVVQVLPEETVEEALRRADQALVEAKRQGRSRAVSAEGDEEEPIFAESRPLGLLAS